MFNLDLMVESSPKTVKLIDFDTCQLPGPSFIFVLRICL